MERLRGWWPFEWSPCCGEVCSPQVGLCKGSPERGGRLPKAIGALGGFCAPINRIWNHNSWPGCYIATELIDGSPLALGTVTEEVATAALKALDAVHARKVLHGDVEARNIMVVRGTQHSVRLVDFGFAQFSSNRNSQKAELRKLQRLLEDMMGVVGGHVGAYLGRPQGGWIGHMMVW